MTCMLSVEFEFAEAVAAILAAVRRRDPVALASAVDRATLALAESLS